MRDIIERIEELLSMQERLVNLLLLSGPQRAKLSTSTAFDVLYYNIELLDLTEELLNALFEAQEEYGKDYVLTLLLETFSWIALLLPAVEESCPVFFWHEPPMQRTAQILSMFEEVRKRGSYHNLTRIAEEVHRLSNLLKHYAIIGRKVYSNLV